MELWFRPHILPGVYTVAPKASPALLRGMCDCSQALRGTLISQWEDVPPQNRKQRVLEVLHGEQVPVSDRKWAAAVYQ